MKTWDLSLTVGTIQRSMKFLKEFYACLDLVIINLGINSKKINSDLHNAFHIQYKDVALLIAIEQRPVSDQQKNE